MDLGTMVHLALLEPDLYIVSHCERPNGMLGEFIDKYLFLDRLEEDDRLKIAYEESGFKLSYEAVIKKFNQKSVQAYIEERSTHGDKIFIDRATKYKVDKAVQAVLEDELAYKLLDPELNAYSELEIYWEDSIKRKSKIDRLVIDVENKVATNVDLKTTSSNVFDLPIMKEGTGNVLNDYIFRGFMASYVKYKYYRQQAYYDDAIRYWLEEKFRNSSEWTIEHKIIAVETSAPFDCAVYSFSDKWIKAGKREVENLIARLKWHKETNYWNKPKDYEVEGLKV